MGPEGDVIATASSLWPLLLLWYGSAGLTAACGVGVLRYADFGAEHPKKKAEESDHLADHHGSTPGERDAAVVILFSALAVYILGYVDIAPLIAVVATFCVAYALGHAQASREARATRIAAPPPQPVAGVIQRKAARPARPRARPGFRRVRSANNLQLHAGIRRVRSANNLQVHASLPLL